MRRAVLAVCAVMLGGCAPPDFSWVIDIPRFRGVRTEVVEPGGYGSLLNVPKGRRRATALPLDTVELEWHVAAPPGYDVPPPIWVARPIDYMQFDILDVFEGELPDCPSPVPLRVAEACRLGEGHKIRVGFGGLYTLAGPRFDLFLLGSREPGLTPAACLERLLQRPRVELEGCIVAMWELHLGPEWAALPLHPDASAVPPEILDQEVDTNPEVLAFRLTRTRGPAREEFVVEPGASVGVRRGDRMRLEPILADDAVQKYWITVKDEENKPWSGEPQEREEQLEHRAWFSAPVRDFNEFDDNYEWQQSPIEWTVPDDVEPTILFFDVRDGRSGRAFAELRFFAEDDP